MKNNKICLINLALDIGGTQRYIADLANFLSANGYIVHILLLSRTPVSFQLDERVNIIQPGFLMQRSAKGKLFYSIKLMQYIRHTLKTISPFVILNASSPSFILMATAWLKYPMYLSIRCNPLHTKLVEGYNVPFVIRRFLYKRAKGIVAQTDFAARVLRKQFGEKKIITIPNYIRQLPNLDLAKKNQVVSVGRLIKSKGFDYLLKSFASAEKKADWKLVIVGDGPERANLETLAVSLGIKEKVLFAGAQNDVNIYLQQSEIFAFTSLYEGFPNALLEAMATPLPCISFNCDAGPADIIDEGKNGFLIPLKDVHAFTEKLSLLMQDEALRANFSTEALKIRQKNSLEKIGASYLNFIFKEKGGLPGQLKGKNIFFYNAIPMPHSLLIHNKLLSLECRVNFWYYKGLTALYPWNRIDGADRYNIFKGKFQDIKKVFTQFRSADFAIITGWHTYMHLVLILTATATGKNFALWVDIDQEEISWFKKMRNKLLLKMAPYLFVTGENGFDILNKQYGIKKSKMIDFPYLGAEFNESMVMKINEERRAVVEQGGNIRLLISNRFIERKGYGVIVEMLQLLDDNIRSQFEILILGIGPEFEFYKKQISAVAKNVHFYQWVEYDVYLDHVMHCDIYLHASLNEPFGIPPNDAMSCGKLVIASSGVISSLGRVSSGTNGFIYEKNNPAELARILTFAANNRDKIYSIGNHALETSKKFTPEYNIRNLETVL